MNEETNTLIAKLYLGKAISRDFSDWAVSCLEQDLDTKSIRILSSMFEIDSISEIDDYFHRALNELGWNFPKREECLERYAKLIARQILDADITPTFGCGEIQNIYYALEYPDYLSNWNVLFWCYEEFSEEEINSQVIQAAEKLLCEKNLIFPKRLEEKPILSSQKDDDAFFIRLWRKVFSYFFFFFVLCELCS